MLLSIQYIKYTASCSTHVSHLVFFWGSKLSNGVFKHIELRNTMHTNFKCKQVVCTIKSAFIYHCTAVLNERRWDAIQGTGQITKTHSAYLIATHHCRGFLFSDASCTHNTKLNQEGNKFTRIKSVFNDKINFYTYLHIQKTLKFHTSELNNDFMHRKTK